VTKVQFSVGCISNLAIRRNDKNNLKRSAIQLRNAILGTIFLLALGCLSGCNLDRINAQQEKATGVWEELIGEMTFGQSFISAGDNFYRIDLSTATFSRTNSAPVIFNLKDSSQANTVIVSITLSGSEIQNERPTSFVFPPITNSAGKSYYFFIESPEATPGNAITVYANQVDQYPDGNAYRNNQAIDGDLAFTAYSRGTYTVSRFFQVTGDRMIQDVPFFIIYGTLILVVICGLLFSFPKQK